MKAKVSGFIALFGLCTLSHMANACCPDGRPVPSGAEEADASCDPAFAFADFSPMKNLADKTAELWSAIQAPSGKKAFSEQEKSEWREISKQMSKSPEAAYSGALSVWGGNQSQDFKRMALTKAAAQVRVTEQIENLTFLLNCLDDVNAQKQICFDLAKGNRLERKIAANRNALISDNPQFAQK